MARCRPSDHRSPKHDRFYPAGPIRGRNAVPAMPDPQSLSSTRDCCATAASIPFPALIDQQTTLEHVARSKIDLRELVPLAAIELEGPVPLVGRDSQRIKEDLLRELRQRHTGGQLCNPPRRFDSERAVPADGPRLGEYRGRSTKALTQSSASLKSLTSLPGDAPSRSSQARPD